MQFIMDMASGENLTDELSAAPDHRGKKSRNNAERTLHAPQARLEMVETTGINSRNASLVGIDITALIDAIEI